MFTLKGKTQLVLIDVEKMMIGLILLVLTERRTE